MTHKDNPLDIPEFLRRRKGDGAETAWAGHDAKPMRRELSRDPRRVEIEKRDEIKRKNSWQKRKGVLSDQEAAAQGLVWDPVHGGWRKP